MTCVADWLNSSLQYSHLSTTLLERGFYQEPGRWAMSSDVQILKDFLGLVRKKLQTFNSYIYLYYHQNLNMGAAAALHETFPHM